MLHLYALAQRPAQLASTDGIGGSKLRVAAVSRAVDAVVSDVDAREGQPGEAAILAHAAVVEELAGLNEALLPARFAGGYPDESALAEAIKEREARVAEALERVRGCVEIALRVLDDSAPENGEIERSGGAYMRRRLEEVRSGERSATEIHEGLAAAARESTCQVLASPQLLLSGAYLVRRGEVEPFRLAVERVERERPSLTFVCTGPWPPYSFAMIDGDGA